MTQDAASRNTRHEEEEEAYMKLYIAQGEWIVSEVDVHQARVLKPGEDFDHGRICRITLDTRCCCCP